MFKYSILLLFLHHALLQTTDKYSDEDRPYKFGFNIQGYQHRQEEKNEKGLIMGEYGFITADGYYRVTVYATDENGDFKILSMKNYYVGFPPEDPTTTPGPAGRSGPGPAKLTFGEPSSPSQGGQGRGVQTQKPFTRPQGLAACSDCSIPTTTARTNKLGGGVGGVGGRTGSFGQGGFPSGDQRPQSGPGFGQREDGTPGTGGFGQRQGGAPGFGGQVRSGGIGSGPSSGQGSSGNFGPGSGGFGQGPAGGTQPGDFGQRVSPKLGQSPNFPQTSGAPGSGFGGDQGNRPGTFGSSDPNGPRRQNDFIQNNQFGDSPGRRPQIGEVRDGLPPGVSVNDIKDLLYTFNYTVGFHGHHEDGYRNGDKQGDYFFDGRDGVERKVEYFANEFGFQPNITLIDLPENDVRRPKEETEKEYGLKGYEFKWFYRR